MKTKAPPPELILPCALSKLEYTINNTIIKISKIDIDILSKTKLIKNDDTLSALIDESTIISTPTLDPILYDKINNNQFSNNISILSTILKQNDQEIKNTILKITEYAHIRNSLIHHNLHKQYKLSHIDIKYRKKYIFSVRESSEFIDTLTHYITNTINNINTTFNAYTDIFVIKKYWDFIFGNEHALNFDDCWVDKQPATYKGPSPTEYAQNIGSPRIACLLSLFLSNFSYGNIICYQDILCLQEAERDEYLKKFSTIVELHKLLNLQTMKLH